MLSALGRSAPRPVAVVRDDPADQQPAEDQPRDIGERVPADGQRPPLHEDGIDRREWQDEGRHRRGPDALASGPRQDRAGDHRSQASPLRERRACGARAGRRSAAPPRRPASAPSGRSSRPISRRGAANPVDRSTASYQAGAQTPSLARRPRRPGQHRRVERNAARLAQRRQHAARIGKHVLALDHRRRAAEPVGGTIEQFRLRRAGRSRRG